MYEKILNSIIEDMANFGLISTIVISNDIFQEMNSKQIKHLEDFLDGNLKWLICSDKKQYYNFIYSFKPEEFEDVR
jgi:hypothetical protein